MASFAKYLILPLLLPMVFAIMFEGVEAIETYPKVAVAILNNLTSHEDLTLHCKAEHDDRGEHTIQYDDLYNLNSLRNLTVSLYSCSFRWASNETLHYINIYNEERDTCYDCYWMIREGGPCAFNFDTASYDNCHAWNSNLQYAKTLTSNHGVDASNANASIEFD
ncbi:S-protein-like protein 5-like [Senna tora]|uniref:S-protein homolog n=1 Tax=Senna tora TaxID=362788 RepID=A0A834T2C3_9FABA|nr:S-protein-like protein 5-like [Senna tora]